jgi:hypothetical protein
MKFMMDKYSWLAHNQVTAMPCKQQAGSVLTGKIYYDKLTTELSILLQQKLMKGHNDTCHNPPDTAPVNIWPLHGELTVPENEQTCIRKHTYHLSTMSLPLAHETLTLRHQIL